MFIEGEFVTLNPYINANRGKWQSGASVMKKMKRMIYVQLPKGKKIPTPCTLHFKWHIKNYKQDPSNIAFCKKYVEDAMVDAKMLENDGHKQIKGFTDTFVKSEKVGVEVTWTKE